MRLSESELILNPDGSIYHLNLRPEHIASTIITVGDPDRVSHVTQHFDAIEFSTQKREFKTETGYYKNNKITVISTGIGTDNIDIVLNELDALVNINLNSRELKKEHTALKIIRIGTSGAIQKNIPIDSFLISKKAIGFDSLLHFYNSKHIQNTAFSKALTAATNWHVDKSKPYVVSSDDMLLKQFHTQKTKLGITATNVGFYGPQGRKLRLETQDADLNNKLAHFSYDNQKITNLEMETAGIYGLAKLLGHHAISMNAIIANRALKTFSKTPEKTISHLIQYTLDKIVQ